METILKNTGSADASKTNSAEPVIEIINLRKSFGTQEVLTDLSMKLYDGENLVVIGKSGTGKSVLIK
jgi:phospholipid/cholesterol/gamma-HCH transport system ATP-binding protein